jgi:hypothetical protein
LSLLAGLVPKELDRLGWTVEYCWDLSVETDLERCAIHRGLSGIGPNGFEEEYCQKERLITYC